MPGGDCFPCFRAAAAAESFEPRPAEQGEDGARNDQRDEERKRLQRIGVNVVAHNAGSVSRLASLAKAGQASVTQA